jgi:hypothetical protein
MTISKGRKEEGRKHAMFSKCSHFSACHTGALFIGEFAAAELKKVKYLFCKSW